MSVLNEVALWCVRDRRTGRITIAQWPNLPLWLFAGAALVAWVAGAASSIGRVAHLASNACIAWWAADELLRGVNPWRRCLGVGVLLWLAWSWLR